MRLSIVGEGAPVGEALKPRRGGPSLARIRCIGWWLCCRVGGTEYLGAVTPVVETYDARRGAMPARGHEEEAASLGRGRALSSSVAVSIH